MERQQWTSLVVGVNSSNTMCAREWACGHSQVKHHVVDIGVCQCLVEVNWRGQQKQTWRNHPTHPTQSPPVCTVYIHTMCSSGNTCDTRGHWFIKLGKQLSGGVCVKSHTYLLSLLVCETHTYTHTHTHTHTHKYTHTTHTAVCKNG